MTNTPGPVPDELWLPLKRRMRRQAEADLIAMRRDLRRIAAIIETAATGAYDSGKVIGQVRAILREKATLRGPG